VKDDILSLFGLAATLLIICFVALQLINVMTIAEEAQHISSSGGNVVSPEGMGVYQDEALTQKVTHIDWGELQPDDTANKTFYLKNEGVSLLTLNLTTINWQPANASIFIICSWNMEGVKLSPSETVQVILTLHVSPNISGITEFSYDTVFSGL